MVAVNDSRDSNTAFLRAATLIASASGLLITAGAGMGVDSGLPDFRGSEGLWKAYPALGSSRLHFQDIACPETFHSDPELAWGFYGHRLKLYRATQPHAGFALLRDLACGKPDGVFVFTSNVDGQFQKSGFAEEIIWEVHGSIHYLQCLAPCCREVWSADAVIPEVDIPACRLTSPLPRCPLCGELARPNVLMFGDWGWVDIRSALQRRRFDAWLRHATRPVIVELGAGTAIPTVRRLGESLGHPLIRINLREPEVRHSSHVGLGIGALEGLRRLAAASISPIAPDGSPALS
jgi:NAD-dependent SIR2 family protein deacetylase